MSYAGRRRVASLAGAAAAAALTALSAWALGGHAPNPDTAGGSAAAPRRVRTVTRTVQVTRHVRAPARVVTRADVPAPAATSAPAARTVSGDGPARPRRRAPARRRTVAKPPSASLPAATGDAGGYRAFAAATAALAGDVAVARTGAGVALDGHAPDVADELGALVDGLPAGRTAFGRAIAMPGDAAATSSSPPAGPDAGQDSGRGSTATSAAHTDDRGSCVHGASISSAEAHAATAGTGPFAVSGGRSRTETSLDDEGERSALVGRALAAPPELTVAPGTPGEIVVRFLGPVELLVRAGGTPGSAAAELGPRGRDAGAPLVEVRAAGRTVRYTAADVLEGGGRTLRFGAVTILFGGAPHAWRGDAGSPPLVGADGTFASAAADALTVRMADDPALVLGHVEAAVAVPARGVRC